MHCCDQCRQLWFWYILEFINEDGQGGISFCSGKACGFHQSLEIMLQVTIVGQAGFWVKVKAYLYVAVLDL